MSDKSDLTSRAEKRCPGCDRTRLIDAFASNKSMPDGRQGYCRECAAAMYRAKQASRGRVVRERVDVPDGHKFCRECSTSKPHDEWSRNRASADGWASYCKACCAERNRVLYFARKYGLAPREVRSLFEAQPVCPICLKNPPAHIDHDHVTGTVRGVLCFTCNAALGQLQDDPTIMRRAAAYVEGQVWQPTKLAPGVYRLPSSLPAARALPNSSATTRPSSSLVDAHPRPPH
jgi:Recombination endonuclease VII